MSLALVVYLIGVLPSVKALFIVAAFLVIGFIIFGAIVNASNRDIWGSSKGVTTKEYLKSFRIWIIVGLSSAFVGTLVPSERTMYVMLAAYGVQQVATNEKTQQILGSGVDILNLQLEKYKDELLKEKSK